STLSWRSCSAVRTCCAVWPPRASSAAMARTTSEACSLASAARISACEDEDAAAERIENGASSKPNRTNDATRTLRHGLAGGLRGWVRFMVASLAQHDAERCGAALRAVEEGLGWRAPPRGGGEGSRM